MPVLAPGVAADRGLLDALFDLGQHLPMPLAGVWVTLAAQVDFPVHIESIEVLPEGEEVHTWQRLVAVEQRAAPADLYQVPADFEKHPLEELGRYLP